MSATCYIYIYIHVYYIKIRLTRPVGPCVDVYIRFVDTSSVCTAISKYAKRLVCDCN